ncbi:hypothetical protein ACO1O0_008592 [Amphichorda felina]
MAEQLSTPRITAPYLDSFVGRLVLLVGKVTQLRGDQATLDSDGTVTVILNRDAHLANGNAAQVIGKVNPDLSIKVLNSKDLGPGVDHGPLLSQPAYSPRVAMVWTQPNGGDDDDDGDGHPLARPSRQRRQSRRLSTSTNYTSFTITTNATTTASSEYGRRRLSSRSRSPTPQPASVLLPYLPSEFTQSVSGASHRSSCPYIAPTDQSLGTHISPTNPSFDSGIFPKTQTSHPYISPAASQEQESIPSAQPVVPIFTPDPSPQQFSISGQPSPLPSPPDSQADTPPSPEISQRPIPPSPSWYPEPISRRHVADATAQNRPARPTVQGRRQQYPKDEELNQDQLFNTVLEGIGRMHVTMGQDGAGRWRIKRSGRGDS